MHDLYLWINIVVGKTQRCVVFDTKYTPVFFGNTVSGSSLFILTVVRVQYFWQKEAFPFSSSPYQCLFLTTRYSGVQMSKASRNRERRVDRLEWGRFPCSAHSGDRSRLRQTRDSTPIAEEVLARDQTGEQPHTHGQVNTQALLGQLVGDQLVGESYDLLRLWQDLIIIEGFSPLTEGWGQAASAAVDPVRVRRGTGKRQCWGWEGWQRWPSWQPPSLGGSFCHHWKSFSQASLFKFQGYTVERSCFAALKQDVKHMQQHWLT